MSYTDALTRMIESDFVHIGSTGPDAGVTVTGRFHTIVVQEDTVFSALVISKPSATADDTYITSNAMDERRLNSKTLKQGAILSCAPDKDNPVNRTDRFFSSITLASGSVIAYTTQELE